jgi:hypothetical protein
MEKFCENLNRYYLEFFQMLSLGGNETSEFKRIFILLINCAFPASFFLQYIFTENLLISVDPLSQATDLFDLFTPVLINFVVLFNFLSNRQLFEKIQDQINKVDKIFNTMNEREFRERKKIAILKYTLKFVSIHCIGIGFDLYILST